MLGWSIILTTVLVLLGLGLLVGAAATSTDATRRGLCYTAEAALLLAALSWFILPSRNAPGEPAPGRGGSGTIAVAPGASLSRTELSLASVTIRGYWKEKDLLEDDEARWSGSGLVCRVANGELRIYTNSHMLNLDSLANADAIPIFTPAEIKEYKLDVIFPTGVVRRVTRFADEPTNLDLAVLAVPASGLVEGKDFVVVPYNPSFQVQTGDKVVAVGDPWGEFPGTQTFGHVSAVRVKGLSGEACVTIQHDAPINPGNSGGPLFCERGDRFFWVGVNTWGRGEGIKMAISSHEAAKANYVWAPCNAQGAAKLIREVRKIPVTVEP